MSNKRVKTIDEMDWAKAKLREMLEVDRERVERAKERLQEQGVDPDFEAIDDLLSDLDD